MCLCPAVCGMCWLAGVSALTVYYIGFAAVCGVVAYLYLSRIDFLSRLKSKNQQLSNFYSLQRAPLER